MKFLKKRYEFIGIDLNYVKSSINIQSFTQTSDQILLIFIIIILKNANNLILELGPYAFMQFLKDTKQDLVDRMAAGSKKAEGSKQILNEFTMFKRHEQDETVQVQLVSNKVKRLIQLLNKEVVVGARIIVPKVIIFVKDRVVAEYLRNIL